MQPQPATSGVKRNNKILKNGDWPRHLARACRVRVIGEEEANTEAGCVRRRI